IIDEFDREIELRRLLAQFERMTGRAASDKLKDRFYGREEQIDELRGYVGKIGAKTWSRKGTRVKRAVTRAMTGRTPMMVWGIGGVGQTTLIAKFMLGHAPPAASHFPLVYLAFDRSTISARNLPGLLIEMCRQVGAQFADLSEPLMKLQESVRDRAFMQYQAETVTDFVDQLRPHLREFRRCIDDHLSRNESLFEWARPFLLVFDTFEIVQYNADDIISLESFVRAFSENDEVWPRLRLIISGRKELRDFLGEVESIELGPLDPKGSAEMLVALAADAGK